MEMGIKGFGGSAAKRLLTRAAMLALAASALPALPALAATSPGDTGLSAMQMIYPGFGPAAMPGSGSTTRLYGTVDNFLDVYKAGPISGVRLQSGGAWTSKLGFFNREDLGGGLSAETVLEAGFNADNGTTNGATPNVLFSRAATVALKSREWGSVTAGRQMGLGTDTFIDPFLAVSKLSVFTYLSGPAAYPGAAVLPDRVDNAVTYATPSFDGFTVMAQAAPSEDTERHGLAVGGLRLAYYQTGLYLTASYTPVWSQPVALAGQSGLTQVRNDLYSVAAEYDTRHYTLSGTYMQYNVQAAGVPVTRIYAGGLMVPVGRDLVRLSMVYRDESGTDKDAFGVMLGYDYTLSKRTFIYGRVGVVKNRPNASYTVDLIPITETGLSPSVLALGISHHF